METSGLTFGRYVLVERIAAGGMGEVFVALQTGIGRFTRPIAVKLLLPHLADDERVVSMFLDEARVGAQMSHANIAQVYDVGQDHQRYFIAMELVRGVSLSGLIAGLKAQNHEQLSADILAHIGRSLAEGLHVAHEQKAPGGKALELIHRDVTPHNILVSVDGAVKLTDFGIAHVADADRQSRPGMVMGKLGYLAPEQILGQPLDRRVDLFAAGATLYHLAALERPFDTPTGAVLDPQRLPATPLRVCRPDLPRQLVDAIERAMENSLERRFHNARELRNALPVPSPDAAEALGAVVRRVCKVSIDELEAKTDRATRALLNKQLPATLNERPAVERRDEETSSVPGLAATRVERPERATPSAMPSASSTDLAAASAKLRGRPWLVLGGAALVFGLLVVAAIEVVNQKEPADAPAVTAVDARKPGTIAPEPAHPEPVRAEPRPDPSKPEPKKPEPTRAETTRPEPKRPEPGAGDEPVLGDPFQGPPKATTPGTLAVDAAPWGEVEVDGKKVGETPIASLKLGPGTHQLVVRNPDNGKSVKKAVVIVSGKPTALRVDLR